MNAENRQPRVELGPVYEYAPVEPSGAQERRIENVGAVRGPDEQHSSRHPAPEALEPVRLLQKADDFLEVAFCVLEAGNVVERHVYLGRSFELLGSGLQKTAELPRDRVHVAAASRNPEPDP